MEKMFCPYHIDEKRQKELGVSLYHVFENTMLLRQVHLVVAENIMLVRLSPEVVGVVGEYCGPDDVSGLCSWKNISKTVFVFIEEKDLYVSVVTHECSHAVARILEMCGIDTEPSSELVATCVGNLTEAVLSTLKIYGFIVGDMLDSPNIPKITSTPPIINFE